MNSVLIQRDFSRYVAFLFVLVALLFNQRIIETYFVYDYKLENPFFVLSIYLAQVIFVGAAIFIFIKRPVIQFTHFFWLIGSFGIALLIGVILLQIFYTPQIIKSGWRSSDFFPSSELNQLSFRGQPIHYSDQDFVIVLLGDSQVEAYECRYDRIPERRLESYLGEAGKSVKVFTIGSRGYGQDQQFLALKEYFQKFRADLVLLWLTFGNDVWNNMFPTHWPGIHDGTPKPTFWLEQGELKGPTEELGEELYAHPVRLIALIQRLRFLNNRDRRWEEFLPEPYKPMDDSQGEVKYEWQYDPKFELENIANEKSHKMVWLSPRSERTKYGLDLTRRLIEQINDLAGNNGAKFMIFMQDVKSQDGVYAWRGNDYALSEKQFQANLKVVTDGFSFLRIQDPIDNPYSEEGIDEKMKQLSQQLVDFISKS